MCWRRSGRSIRFRKKLINFIFDDIVLKELNRSFSVIPAKAGIQNQFKDMLSQKYYYVYVLASKKNGTLYIGVTNNLERRIYEHKNDLIKGFTTKYKIHHLVYYEYFNDIRQAILREKQMKKWNRQWKINLIKEENPGWNDLSEKWTE